MASMEREHSQDREFSRTHGASFSSLDRTIPMYVYRPLRLHTTDMMQVG